MHIFCLEKGNFTDYLKPYKVKYFAVLEHPFKPFHKPKTLRANKGCTSIAFALFLHPPVGKKSLEGSSQCTQLE